MPKTFEPIASTTLAAAAANISFTSIPDTFTDLVLVCDGSTSSAATLYLDFNGGSVNQYSTTELRANGSAVTVNQTTNQMQFRMFTTGTTAKGMYVVQIMQYANTNVFKTILGNSGRAAAAVERHAGFWRNTDPLASLRVFPSGGNLNAGFSAALYGIKAA